MLKAKLNLLSYAGNAKPNPKMGQALGPLGINMMQFCKEFNAQTSEYHGDVPLRIRLYGAIISIQR
jgi:large subunit ribosomal protein L11